MNIFCNICQEALMPSDTIYGIHCGHIFHFSCLTNWLARSATCPHCRQVASTNKIHRIYFSFGNDKAIQEFLDLPLERQINNLKFQILLKEKDINYYASKSVILEKQNSGLRQEVRKVESEIKQKDSVIHDLKEQMLRLKKKRLDYEILKKKLSQKEKELQQYKQGALVTKDQIRSHQVQHISHNHLAEDNQKANIQRNVMHDENEHECLHNIPINKIERPINNKYECNHVKKFDSKRSAKETSNIYRKGKIDRKKKTGNDLKRKTEIVTFSNIIQKNSTLNDVDATLDNCPTIKKKTKLFQ